MLTYGAAFGTAFFLALLLTPLVRRVSGRIGAVDRPDTTRKLHGTPIPKLGGIAVVLAFYLAISLLPSLSQAAAADAALAQAGDLLPAALLILALGIADDLWAVRPWVKIAVQLAAGLFVYYGLEIRIQILSSPIGAESLIVGGLSLPVTLFWILLITNAFNIVDGMDGLAAGVAFIATCCMFLISIQMDNPSLAALTAPLAGALLGFLRYNFNPASIFLGDSGSLSLGFLLAVLSIPSGQKSTTAISIAAPLFVLALPIIETLTSTLRRFLRGQPIMTADSGHIHHQLLRRGFSPRRAALLLYIGSALFGLGSLFLTHANGELAGATVLVFGIVAWLGIQQLGYAEFVEINQAFKRGFLYQRRIIQNNILTRRLADDLRASGSLAEAWERLTEVAELLEFAEIELRVDVPLPSRHAGAATGGALRWRAADGALDPHACRELSVRLMGSRGSLGEVVMTRRKDADRLHSELPLLVDTLSDCLPRLIEAAGVPAASVADAAVRVSRA